MRIAMTNKNKFLTIIMIFLMFFSMIPLLNAEDVICDLYDPTTNKNGSSTIPTTSEASVLYWCAQIGLLDEPEFNQERYLAKNIAELGPELITKRTVNTKVYLGPNDRLTYEIYTGNVHYKTLEGSWDEIDLKISEYNLIPTGTEIKYDYANEDNTIHTYFRDGYSQPGVILTRLNGDDLGSEPLNMAYIDPAGNEYPISQPTNSKAVVKNNKILYPDTYPNSADLFIVEENTLKHEILLDSIYNLPAISDLSVTVSDLAYTWLLSPSNDLELFMNGAAQPVKQKLTTTEELHFYTSTGSRRFTLPAPVAFEHEDQAEMTICKYSVEPLPGGKIKISVLTPYSWLTDPARTYPVVIDPTVFRYSDEELTSNDTFIAYTNNLNVDNNYGKDHNLLIGGNLLNESTLIKFDISSLPDKQYLLEDALLKLTTSTYEGFHAEEANVSIHKVTQDWVEGTGTLQTPTNNGATWNSPTGTGSTWSGGAGGAYVLNPLEAATNVAGPNEEYEFEIDDLVTGWRNSPTTNYGLLVKYKERESWPNRFKTFHSSGGTLSGRPKLEVVFLNTPPTVKGTNRYEWNEDEEDESTVINLNDHFTDADHQPLNITLWNGSAWRDSFICSIFTAKLKNYGNPADPEYFCTITLKPNKWGSQYIRFNATDGISVAEAKITIAIESINDPPILIPIGDQEATEGEYLVIPLEAIEVEGQQVFWNTNVSTYGEPNYMENLWIESFEGDEHNEYKKQIRYIPDNSDVPRVDISITIRDAKDSEITPSRAWENITIDVTNVNDDPMLTKVKDTVVIMQTELGIKAKQSERKTFHVQAYDDDIINGDKLKFYSDAAEDDDFNITPLYGSDIPMAYDSENTQVAKIAFTPANHHVGEYDIIITVEDEEDSTDEIKLKFNIENSPDPPEIKSYTISPPSDLSGYTNHDLINFSCVVDDLDLHLSPSVYQEELNITWLMNISSMVKPFGYGASLLNKLLPAGEYEIKIVVTDLEENKAEISFNVVIRKAITLQDKCDRTYKRDNSTFDDIEYSYNHDTKKITISQGLYGEIDVVRLESYYDDTHETLVIKLKFYENLTAPVDFNIKIYLVKPQHIEPSPNYDAKYSQNFFEIALYSPSDDQVYGYFTETDGNFNGNEFIVEYSLADLEEGITGEFLPLEGDFEIFVVTTSYATEYINNIKVENFRYDSIGHISAYAPPPSSISGGGDPEEKTDNTSTIMILVMVIIVIIILAAVMLLKSRATKKKTVIDFSQTQTSLGQPVPQTQIPQMFMSPFEQQFKRPLPTMPPGSVVGAGAGAGPRPGPMQPQMQQMPPTQGPGGVGVRQPMPGAGAQPQIPIPQQVPQQPPQQPPQLPQQQAQLPPRQRQAPR